MTDNSGNGPEGKDTFFVSERSMGYLSGKLRRVKEDGTVAGRTKVALDLFQDILEQCKELGGGVRPWLVSHPDAPGDAEFFAETLTAATPFELTLLEKTGGNVSKLISLGDDGKIRSDGRQCWISLGKMRRIRQGSLYDLAHTIDTMPSHQALALGAMNADLPDAAPFCARKYLPAAPPAYVTRTGDYIGYKTGARAVTLLDYDRKSIPPNVMARIEELGGFLAAITHLCPEFKNAGYVLRQSTSSGLFNDATGQRYESSGGTHTYVIVEDGTDARRFLYTLRDRGWLAGLSYYEIGKAGQLLERSIVDWSVGTGERIVFEGAPYVEPPLKQEPRKSTVFEGRILNTRALPDRILVSKPKFDALKMQQQRSANRVKSLVKKTLRKKLSRYAPRIQASHQNERSRPWNGGSTESCCLVPCCNLMMKRSGLRPLLTFSSIQIFI